MNIKKGNNKTTLYHTNNNLKLKSELPRGKPTRHRLENNFDFETSLGAFKSRLSSKEMFCFYI
jgi:hypothetical protein